MSTSVKQITIIQIILFGTDPWSLLPRPLPAQREQIQVTNDLEQRGTGRIVQADGTRPANVRGADDTAEREDFLGGVATSQPDLEVDQWQEAIVQRNGV